MKKHIYKLMVGLLIGATAFGVTGCSNNIAGEKSSVSQDIPMGRYIEETVDMPKEIKSLIDYKVNSDGTMEIHGYASGNQVVAYTSKDGKSWESKDATWLNDLISAGNQLSAITSNEKGEYYALYYNPDFKTRIGKLSEGNKVEEIPYEVDESSYISAIKVDEEGSIFVGMNNGVVRINEADGSVITEYSVTGTEGEVVVVDNQLMVIDAQRGGLVAFNLESGDEENFIPYEGTLWGSKLLSNDEGNVYIVNTEGVSRLAPGGSIWENVIESSTSSFGTPSLFVRQVAMKGNDEFSVAFDSVEGAYTLLNYHFDPNVPSRPTTEVNLYMLEDNRTIRQAVAEYQRQNQEVFINIQVGIQEGDTLTKADAIRTLNTQLLAGKGPDILVLDGLPIQSYMEKGVLLDMSDWVDGMRDSGKWLENITEAYRQEDGSIYALPTRFKVPTLWGNKELVNGVDSLEGLADWAKENPDKQVFYSMTPEELMKKLYGITAHEWMDETGQIKEDAFVTFIESINTLSGQGGADEAPSMNSSSSGMTIEFNDADDPAIQESIKNTLSTEYMAHKDVELHMTEVEAFMEIPYLNSAIMQRGDGDFGAVLAKDGGVYNPVGIVGINANSKNKDIASEIVKLAMSKEVQKVDLYEGFPIDKEALEEQAIINEDGMMAAMGMAIEKPIKMQPATQESYTKLKEQVDKLTIPAMTDEVLMNLIIEETKGYFDGEKTANEAAEAAAKRTRAYLAE